jgi:hypothetical protein
MCGLLYYKQSYKGVSMPTINGLTYYQKDLLDCMWEIDTPEEFQEWYQNLDHYDQKEVDLLKLMLVYDLLDDVYNLDQAREVIDRIK